MKRIISAINRAISSTAALTVLTALLYSNVMIGQAFAVSYCNQSELGTQGSCASGQTCTEDSSGVPVCTPELSDYVAMGLVVAAGIMVYRIRQRSVVHA